MKVDLNWKNIIPKHQIYVGKLNSPSDIDDIMREFKIEKYLYMITYGFMVIKYGMSCPSSKSARHGDRIYRQIGHCKGWGDQRLTGSSGSDWRIIEEDFETFFGTKLDHTKLQITIYDLTNYSFETINPKDEVKAMENQLIEEYVSATGHKPIGNINDEATIKRKPGTKKDLWSSLFS